MCHFDCVTIIVFASARIGPGKLVDIVDDGGGRYVGCGRVTQERWAWCNGVGGPCDTWYVGASVTRGRWSSWWLSQVCFFLRMTCVHQKCLTFNYYPSMGYNK